MPRIVEIAAAVPSHVDRPGDEWGDAVIAATGVHERRIGPHTTGELCLAAARALSSLDVGAVLVLSQTADTSIPALSCRMQHALGLPESTICLDLIQGCSGYVYGLAIAEMIARSHGVGVLLLVGDTMHSLCEPNDRATAPLFGHAGTATVVSPFGQPMSFWFGTNGEGEKHLRLKASGKLHMNGPQVFAFALDRVPRLIKGIRPEGSTGIVVCHQANGLLLEAIRRASDVPREAFPVNVDRFGNAASASIPLAIVTEKVPLDHAFLVGFGVGWSWGAAEIQSPDCVIHPLVEVE